MSETAARIVALRGDPSAKAVGNVPHSVAAEQALLGAIMVNNRCYDDLQGRLLADHFYVPMHGAVFAAIEAIVNGRGGEANPITIRERLKGTAFDSDNALFPHLTQMFENAGFAGDVRSLAEVVITAFRQRQLMGLAESLHTQAKTASSAEAVDAVLDSAGSELFRLEEVGAGRSTMRSLREHLLDVLQHAEAAKLNGTGVTGIATGFHDIDRLLSGLQPSDLIILGARPSMGKTSLLINIAQSVAERYLKGEPNSAPVAVFSLEMSAHQLTQRILSRASNVGAQQLGNGQLSEGDFLRVTQGAMGLRDLPLHIDDTPGLSISALRSRARQLKRKYGIGLIIVDYLQLLTAQARGEYNRVQEISEISQGLKHVARELDVPVVAASQLSRQVESRDNKRPQLSDLRDSGTIEQDADVVMMLFREEFYVSRALGAADEMAAGNDAERRRIGDAKDRLAAVKGLAEVLVPKNRKGPTDTVKLMFEAATTTFHNFSARA